MGILILLVIATILIVGVFVGYNAWQGTLHEEVETHSKSIQFETFGEDKFTQIEYYSQSDQNILIN